jgi:hypothetical protein
MAKTDLTSHDDKTHKTEKKRKHFKNPNFLLKLAKLKLTGNRNQSTLFYYHARHYSFQAIPYHNTGTGIGEKFPPFPLFLCVSNIANDCHELPMPMLSQKSQCRHVSEETYALQIPPEPD